MKPSDRQEQILGLLRTLQREWSVEDLASSLNVSPITIRRDLEQLEAKGVIIRTHGGCLPVLHSGFEATYQNRIASNFSLKQKIGRRAAEEVREGECILIFDGSTTYHMLGCIGELDRLTVYTNSIAFITELSRFPSIEIYLLGGRYNRTMYFLQGSLTERVLDMVRFDAIFLGVDGIDTEGHCLVANHETARMHELMLKQDCRKVLLADHTKVGRAGRVRCGDLSQFGMWITTRGGTSGSRGKNRKPLEAFTRVVYV